MPLTPWNPDPKLYWITPLILAMRSGDPDAAALVNAVRRQPHLAAIVEKLLPSQTPALPNGNWVPKLAV